MTVEPSGRQVFLKNPVEYDHLCDILVNIILVPLGIALVMEMIPGEVLDEYRLKAEATFAEKRPRNGIAGGVILLIWIVLIAPAFGI